MTAADPHLDYLLHLADTALVLGQRNAEWCAQAPALEEDIALGNLSLDLIGQARLLYQHAAGLLGDGSTEDTLAYFRDAPAYRNWVICELPHQLALAPLLRGERDFAVTIARNHLTSSYFVLAWQGLLASRDAQLAAIAERSVKEARYHVEHSRDWVLRLGDGTKHSHQRMQAAFDHLMPYTQEFWLPSASESALVDQGIAVDPQSLRAAWDAALDATLSEASLTRPATSGHVPRGKWGEHSEHLSYLLAEMQSLARAHPGATW